MSPESEIHTPDSSPDDLINEGPEAVTSQVSSPGELLRRARESMNLTVQDLAGQTRLSRAVLEALERNDFASLAMPVYVRGYFRKCAHVLNLPEDRLLQAYADWTGTPLKPQPVPITVTEPPQEYSSPQRTPSWRYVLVIAIVLGAALWWFGSGDENTGSSVLESSQGVTTLDIPPLPAETQPLPLVPVADPTAMLPADAGTATATAPAPGVPAPGLSAAPVRAPSLGPVSATTLQMSITQASWVEIIDDDNRRLAYGLLSPGTEQRMTGKLPYTVILGHPQGVQLSLGGRAINLTPYTSNNGTARFEVEEP